MGAPPILCLGAPAILRQGLMLGLVVRRSGQEGLLLIQLGLGLIGLLSCLLVMLRLRLVHLELGLIPQGVVLLRRGIVLFQQRGKHVPVLLILNWGYLPRHLLLSLHLGHVLRHLLLHLLRHLLGHLLRHLLRHGLWNLSLPAHILHVL